MGENTISPEMFINIILYLIIFLEHFKNNKWDTIDSHILADLDNVSNIQVKHSENELATTLYINLEYLIFVPLDNLKLVH